jgi:1-phosphofructokinase/tagatose 6-phosphate kinase
LSNYTGRVLKDTNEIIDACRKIVQDGVDIVVTSLGSEGAILVSNEEILLGKIPTVEVINTIGSGDSVVAGLAFGYSHGYSVKEMLRLGIACGIANTQFAQIGIVSKELVQKYLKDIEIKIVDE